MRPTDIAKKLNISTSSLRFYEAKGMIPPLGRTESNYRVYEDIHLAYFEGIVAMKDGFGLELTEWVMKKIQNKEVTEAFEKINEVQVAWSQEKRELELKIERLLNPVASSQEMTISGLAKEAKVTTAAIRHWEKEGFIRPNRNQENAYRVFNHEHLRDILLIQLINSTTWLLSEKKNQFRAVDPNDKAQLEALGAQAKDCLHYKMMAQMKGIQALYSLCQKLNLT